MLLYSTYICGVYWLDYTTQMSHCCVSSAPITCAHKLVCLHSNRCHCCYSALCLHGLNIVLCLHRRLWWMSELCQYMHSRLSKAQACGFHAQADLLTIVYRHAYVPLHRLTCSVNPPEVLVKFSLVLSSCECLL